MIDFQIPCGQFCAASGAVSSLCAIQLRMNASPKLWITRRASLCSLWLDEPKPAKETPRDATQPEQ